MQFEKQIFHDLQKIFHHGVYFCLGIRSLITAQKPNKPNHWLLALKQAHKYVPKIVYFTQN